MKVTRVCSLSVLASALVFALNTSAAMILTAAGTAGDHLFIGSPLGTLAAKYNTVPAGSSANIYYDVDQDGIFGETGIGENSGNTASSLAFNTAPITSGTVMHFGVEGFTTPDDTGIMEFTLLLTDASRSRQVVAEGTPVTFFDSTGDEWSAEFLFNYQGYGDVVRNIDSVPGGATLDHQGVLTFTQVPEPASLALLALGMGALLVVNRRR